MGVFVAPGLRARARPATLAHRFDHRQRMLSDIRLAAQSRHAYDGPPGYVMHAMRQRPPTAATSDAAAGGRLSLLAWLQAVPWREPRWAWPLSALAFGVLASTQFLAQPFVWRHWPVDEVLIAWLDVLRDRVIVALAIAAALLAARRWRVESSYARSAKLGLAIVAGATLGEAVLMAIGSLDVPSGIGPMVARIARWSAIAIALALMLLLWRRAAAERLALELARLRQAQAQHQSTQLQLQLLRSQIEPHFLFNTLATVRRLHETDAGQGASLLRHLIEYLELTSGEQAVEVTLAREVMLVRAYLAVAGRRMAGRMKVRIDVPDALGPMAVPPFSLATLVENAVKHGIAPMPGGGTIQVEAHAQGNVLHLSVADDGAGLSGHGGSGIGLANVRERLQTLYGGAAHLALLGRVPLGVRATIRLPLERLP